jgi:hypothetical protein
MDDHLALVHHLAVVHQHLLVLGDQELVLGALTGLLKRSA